MWANDIGMNSLYILLALTCCATAHLVIAIALFIYAHHRVRYMALAAVNGIFCLTMFTASFFSGMIAAGHPGILHPMMLLVLMAVCFLQSIYPTSIPLPGFLQAWRMWKYASPALIIIALYVFFLAMGGKLVNVYSLHELLSHTLSSDMILRIAAMGYGAYYIINIFQLPRLMSHDADIPIYIIGYCGILGCLFVFYSLVTIFYSPRMLIIYLVLFTLSNFYLFLRVLESLAVKLPKPEIVKVQEEPEMVSQKEDNDENFNELNLQRFRRLEFWMQNNKEEWMDSSFGRDKLCTAVGYNRHLILQAVRSQDYNNVHDYITRYRIEELKLMVLSGEIKSVADTARVGFGAVATARSCFERLEGGSLDEFLAEHANPSEA